MQVGAGCRWTRLLRNSDSAFECIRCSRAPLPFFISNKLVNNLFSKPLTLNFYNLKVLKFFFKFSKFSLLFNLWLPFRSQFKAPLSPMMTVNDWCNERAFSMNLLDKYPTQNIHWVYSFNLAKKRGFFFMKVSLSLPIAIFRRSFWDRIGFIDLPEKWAFEGSCEINYQ